MFESFASITHMTMSWLYGDLGAVGNRVQQNRRYLCMTQKESAISEKPLCLWCVGSRTG